MKYLIVSERNADGLIPGDDILVAGLEGLITIIGVREVEPIQNGKVRMLTMDDGSIRAVKSDARIAVLEKDSI